MEDFRPEDNLIPHIVDHYARTTPEKVYAEYPRSPDTYKDGFVSVGYLSFANAINGLAWWLVDTLGPGDGEVLAYIGTNDVRYPALVIGAIKAGYCIFLVSPRNSQVAYESLFKSTNCTKLLSDSSRQSPVQAIADGLSMEVIEVPSVDELLFTEHPHFEFSKTYPENKNDTMAIIHTSGSTGIPKPVVWPLEVANKHIRMMNMQAPNGFSSVPEEFRGSKFFFTLPPFHAAGIGIPIFVAIPSSLTLVIPISGALPTVPSLVEAAKETEFRSAFLAPSMLNDLAHSDELLNFCSENLDVLMFGGGDLPQAIGNKVAKRLKIINMYGASEFGIPNSVLCDSNHDPLQDWKYIQFHPQLGVELRHVMDDKHELVFVRTEETEKHLMPFAIFPDANEYHTRDLFIRHTDPEKSNLWQWCSRLDDVIVFLNGEKTNPVSMEQHINASNANVKGVLVYGSHRFQASLVIEYGGESLSPHQRAGVIEELWPAIEEANAFSPAHAQIARTHILFTTPDKPMLRAGKGTIQRAATLALYEAELDALYADADTFGTSGAEEISGPGPVTDSKVVSEYIRRVLISLTRWSEDELSNTANFFHLGFDSLKTITAARSFSRGFYLPGFTPNLIYLNPSVNSLTEATLRLMRDNEKSVESIKADFLEERQSILEKMIGHLGSHSHTVLLTGSTGALGTYLLDALLRNSAVKHVHCLNRRQESQSFQFEKNNFYNLDTSFPSDRVSFWHVDLARKDFGLDVETLNKLRETATVILHNAWNVNFNLSLPSFEPDLLGVVNLVNFAASSELSPHIFFVSSISSAMGQSAGSDPIPESVVPMEPSLNGYANSKYISEHIIDHAVKHLSVRASIARVGQIAGAVKAPGLWNKQEWFPSLVMSSRQVGAIPKDLGRTVDRVDWVPIDLLADVLADFALGEPSSPGTVDVFHPLNLYPSTWNDIAPIVSDALHSLTGEALETVPLSEWIQRVRRDMQTTDGEAVTSEEKLREKLEKNPAAKLLDFFEKIDSAPGHSVFDTQKTSSRSNKLRAVDGVKKEWILKWVGEWMA